MTGFKVIFDDLGIETCGASLVGRSHVTFFDNRNKIRPYGAIAIRPVSTESTTSGTLKGAAWGLILAGPLGVAIGSMVGGGMKVAFEMDTLEGETLRCIAGKGAYLKIRNRVEKQPAQPKKVKGSKVEQTGPRRVSWPLMIGLVLLPILFVWFLLRPRHTVRARAIGFGWLLLWFAGIGALPEPPVDETGAVTEVTAPLEP